jgi:UDP-2,4-diacetamido-2,4,6-trideoxy-beta-L-altropyranose hydrolase
MNIVFRVDSSNKMGVGHLIRCLTLADELNKKNYKIIFICRDLEGSLISLIKYAVLTLPKNNDFQSNDFYLNWLGATQEQDAKQTIATMPEGTDLMVVDSYALDKKWHKILRPHIKKIIVIDDLADRQFDCDVLLNQNFGTQEKEYKNKVPDDCELLLGCDYALLRPEFSELREQALKKRKNTSKIKNILISVGGSDVNNLTYDILQELSGKFCVVVVLGRTSPHNRMIMDYAQDKDISVIVDADNMAELMMNADLSIGAGGSTSWERCCLGLPTLLFITAENQRVIAESLERLGASIIVKNLRNDLQTIVGNFSLWRKMSEKAQTVCDGTGVKRIKI